MYPRRGENLCNSMRTVDFDMLNLQWLQPSRTHNLGSTCSPNKALQLTAGLADPLTALIDGEGGNDPEATPNHHDIGHTDRVGLKPDGAGEGGFHCLWQQRRI